MPDRATSTSPQATVAPESSTTSLLVAPPTAAPALDTGDISGFEVIDAILGGRSLALAHADEPSLRSRGLMGVVDLGDLDGMLFSWGGDPVSSRFTMRNTLIPLRIVFFDATGAFVSTTDMVPCETEECPTYGAAGPYAFAIEFPAGTPVSTEDRLEVDLSG